MDIEKTITKISAAAAAALTLSFLCGCDISGYLPSGTAADTAGTADTAAVYDAEETGSAAPQSTETAEKLGFQGGNISAGGLMCMGDDGRIYYRSESDGWKLYSALPSGEDKRLVSEDTACCINVLDGAVYYLSRSDGFALKRVNADGSGGETLAEGYCGDLYAAESGLYFDMRDENNSPNVFRTGLDGSGTELLVSGMAVGAYHGGVIFCRNTRRLAAYHLDSGETEILLEKYTHNVSADESGLYYWLPDESRFCRMDLETREEETLVRGGDFFNYTDGHVYYQSYGGDNYNYFCIYAYDVATGETETLCSFSDEYFGFDGRGLGITMEQMRDPDFYASLDPSMFSEDGFIGLSESAGYAYSLGGEVITRGTLREGIAVKGSPGCLILCEGGGAVWD